MLGITNNVKYFMVGILLTLVRGLPPCKYQKINISLNNYYQYKIFISTFISFFLSTDRIGSDRGFNLNAEI